MGLSDAIMVTFTNSQFYIVASGGFVYMNKDGCLAIACLIFVFGILLFAALIGTKKKDVKATGYEYTSDTKKYGTTETIEKTFIWLKNWAMIKNYKIKRKNPPMLITIKPCYLCSDLDIELSKDGDKTILTVSSSGKQVYVDKAFNKFKDFVAELLELD